MQYGFLSVQLFNWLSASIHLDLGFYFLIVGPGPISKQRSFTLGFDYITDLHIPLSLDVLLSILKDLRLFSYRESLFSSTPNALLLTCKSSNRNIIASFVFYHGLRLSRVHSFRHDLWADHLALVPDATKCKSFTQRLVAFHRMQRSE